MKHIHILAADTGKAEAFKEECFLGRTVPTLLAWLHRNNLNPARVTVWGRNVDDSACQSKSQTNA